MSAAPHRSPISRFKRPSTRPSSRASFECLERRKLLAVDLTGSLNLPSGIFAPGAIISGSFTLTNNGDTPAGPFDATITLSTDQTLGNGDDLTITTFTIPGALPGDTTQAATVTVPALIGSNAYFVFIDLDSGSAIAETDENNNVVSTDLAQIHILSGSGVLPIAGTNGNDTINITESAGTLTVDTNGTVETFSTTQVLGITVFTGAGDDIIVLGPGVPNAYVLGGAGKDRIVGSDGNDFLVGGGGRDRIDGGNGNDRIGGGAGNDVLQGQAGFDRLFGDAGDDVLIGGANPDRLNGGTGSDLLDGGGSNDFIAAADGNLDDIFAGPGNDTVDHDELLDNVSGAETVT